MSFVWTEDRIRFFLDAAGESDYYRILASRIHAALPDARRICDAGCGLGDLALALAEFYPDVTAADNSPAAIRTLKSRLVPGVRAVEADLTAYTPDVPFDAMVFCYYGGMEEILSIARRCCRDTVFIVKRNYLAHRFSPADRPDRTHGADAAAEFLRQRGIPFAREDLAPEFGQPFRSLADAKLFFESYDPGAHSDEALIGKLKRTEDEKFPYYFPQTKPVSLFWFKI